MHGTVYDTMVISLLLFCASHHIGSHGSWWDAVRQPTPAIIISGHSCSMVYIHIIPLLVMVVTKQW